MQDEKSDVVFGTSVVGGFKRKNVLSYIEKLQNLLSQYGAAAEEKQTLLQQADQALRDLRLEMQAKCDALDAAAEENARLRVQLEAARLEARQARQEAAQLRTRRKK